MNMATTEKPVDAGAAAAGDEAVSTHVHRVHRFPTPFRLDCSWGLRVQARQPQQHMRTVIDTFRAPRLPLQAIEAMFAAKKKKKKAKGAGGWHAQLDCAWRRLCCASAALT